MNLEGRIDILLTRHGDAPATVSIHSTRPQLAQKLLAGRSPEEAAHLAGLVFSLCGKAQRVAAEAACEAAQGQIPDAAASRARETAVLLELAQEHAWRLLLDWPQQQGMPPDQASQLRLRQSAADPLRFAETLDDLLLTTLLGEPANLWLGRDLAGFDAWRHAGGTATARLFAGLGEGADSGISEVDLLPPLGNLEEGEAHELARQALEHPAFCGQPLWHGAPAETGALARVHEQPLLAAWIARRGRGAGARLLARLLELAELPTRLSDLGSAGIPAGSPVSGKAAGKDAGATGVRAWSLGDNSGLAAVETSRGLLLHMVRLRESKVAEYRIVAPTEWNFHPAGPLFQALSGLAPGDGLEARARLVAQSLDPCVAFGIEVKDA
ncbi:MAG: nickel-dependent hydrogenase large subunit [Pseudomonadota bacterium]|nr:nickel-dependent hydrogenase large subunit [Pseudomonadota bacterium]